MSIQEIKTAVDQGKTVHWASGMYKVIKDKNGNYLIKCTSNGSCVGLTSFSGKLNGKQEDFFI